MKTGVPGGLLFNSYMINYKFCPQCKNDLSLSGEYPYCPSCNLTIYRNSKPCVTILPIKDGQVLLSKRGINPYKGDWDTIGGFLEPGEHPEVGALRETLEETGLNVKITGLFGVYMDKYGDDGDDVQINAYLAEVISGNVEAKDDVASLEWVDINKIDTITSRFKAVVEILRDLKQHYS